MENIDIALMISLDIKGNEKAVSQYEDTIQKLLQEIDDLKKEIIQVRQEKSSNSSDNGLVIATAEAIKLQVQRDTYKELYENLIAKVMAS